MSASKIVVPAPDCVTVPVPLMVLPTLDTPEIPVKCNWEALSSNDTVLPAAPKELPVPKANVLPALTVVEPAKELLLPVRVKVPAPA